MGGGQRQGTLHKTDFSTKDTDAKGESGPGKMKKKSEKKNTGNELLFQLELGVSNNEKSGDNRGLRSEGSQFERVGMSTESMRKARHFYTDGRGKAAL